jgi:hypothetical protein
MQINAQMIAPKIIEIDVGNITVKNRFLKTLKERCFL